MKMSERDWMQDEKLQGISQQKLEFLRQFAAQGSSKSQTELLPFLMAAASRGKNSGIRFSQEEVSLILAALKQGKSKKEQEKLDKLVNLMKMMNP